jgi:Tol biopolymer transport system component
VGQPTEVAAVIGATSDGSGVPRRLTDDPADDRFGRVLPDGSLVFESDRSGGYRLYLDPGGSARPLTDGRGEEFGPAVSRDGRWVAFVGDRDGSDQLFVVRPDGSGLARLTSGIADRGAATWAP